MTINIPAELAGTYTLDSTHSRFGFVARHAMVTKVRGSFTEFEGTGTVDTDNPSKSSAQVTLKVDSITTSNEQRDGHLRTNDFFDAPNYPEITFTSTGVELLDEETFNLNGDLTIKGVTKPVSIRMEYSGFATDPYGNQRLGLEGSTTINRREFGVDFHATLETGGVLVSDKIKLEFDISAIKDTKSE